MNQECVMSDNGDSERAVGAVFDSPPEPIKLITAVVQRGKADDITQAAIAAGAQAATISFGRGQGIRERLGLLGLAIQPEKEIISIVIEESLLDQVVAAMVRTGHLDQPGIGFLYVTPVERTIGMLAPAVREDMSMEAKGGRRPFRGRRG
jgi:nitrogen regulatory protein P-II 1